MIETILYGLLIVIGAPCPIGLIALLAYVIFKDHDGVVRM